MKGEAASRRPMPVRKGGTRYPRQGLEDALKWAGKLVSKTHTNPQPEDVIFSGVVGAKGSRGDVRVSTLRQYGLLSGDSKGYDATELAKQLNVAPPEDRPSLLRRAALHPAVFKNIYETFQSDSVTRAKLKQRASDLKVHPDEAENCVEIYVATALMAGLITVDGDKVNHASLTGLTTDAGASADVEADNASTSDADLFDSGGHTDPDVDSHGVDRPPEGPTRRAAVSVSLTVDSTMDVDKLEKQLRLLKKYGAL